MNKYSLSCIAVATLLLLAQTLNSKVSDGKHYIYAPSVVGTKTFACANIQSGLIKDVIVEVSNKNIESVLVGDKKQWDARHVCDPDVVKGKFSYKNKVYNQLMVYTGSNDPFNNGTCNDLGFAIKSDETNWVKVGKVPFLKSNQCVNATQWGRGQASLISLDRQSRVMLFYFQHQVGLNAVFLELSNLEKPVLIKTIFTGLKEPQPDVAFNPYDRYFLVLSAGLFNAEPPKFISKSENLWLIKEDQILNGLVEQRELLKSFSTSGKIHNGTIETDEYGYTNGVVIKTLHSHSQLKPWPDSLWSYEISKRFETEIELDKLKQN